MNARQVRWLLMSSVAALCMNGAYAQLSKPTTEELSRKGNGPGPVAGGTRANNTSSGSLQPSTDPRDFSGSWRGGGPGGAPGGGAPGGAPGGGAPGGAGGPGGPGGGDPGAPGGAGGPGGGAPGGAPPGGAGFDPNSSVPKGALPDRIICLPQTGIQTGGEGPLLIMQSPDEIIWAAEEMHSIRRIFLKGEHTKNFKPNYLGEAIGHWEGNTMVVETIGAKGMAPGAKTIERWTKSADGTSFQLQVTNVDASGKATGAARTQTLSWRNGEPLLEWICEDYNDEWLPGGSDYTDQLKK